jgi:membrane-associated phospholipid phosphatase
LVFLLSLFAVALQFGRHAGIFKSLPIVLIALSVLLIPSRATAQIATPDQSSPAAVPANEPAAPPANELPETVEPPAQSPGFRASDRLVSWKLLFGNVMSDQKQIWTFPVRLAQGKNWIPTTAVVGTTAGLMFLDSRESRYFRTTTSFNGFKNIVTGNAAAIGMGAVPASLYAIGLVRKDSKMQSTALFAGEALADTVLVQTALKDIARRVKPARYPTTGWFSSKGPPTSYLRGNGSFPSGHSMAAFSVATIVARQYGNHRWVPYVAYGLAGLVGFSRLPLNVHFLSDVFMGGAIGYSISRFTVLRQ